MYKHLIGQTVDDILVTEEIYQMAVNRLIGLRRRKYKDLSDDDILKNYITEEDVKKGILPIYHLITKNSNPNRPPRPAKITHNTIRDVSFALDELVGYTESEKEFITQRMNEYIDKLTLTNPNDYFLVRQVVLYELSIEKINILMVADPLDNNGYQKKLNLIMETYLKLCDSLNTLKKQREKGKSANEGGLKIHETIQEISGKTIEEMEEERESEEEEERRMMKKKKKRE